MYYLAVTGGSIDYRSASCYNTHMAAYHDDVTGL